MVVKYHVKRLNRDHVARRRGEDVLYGHLSSTRLWTRRTSILLLCKADRYCQVALKSQPIDIAVPSPTTLWQCEDCGAIYLASTKTWRCNINIDARTAKADSKMGSEASNALSPSSASRSAKLQLPMSCDPPGPQNPPKQLVWVVSNTATQGTVSAC